MLTALGAPTRRALLSAGRTRRDLRGRLLAVALPRLLLWAVARSAAAATQSSGPELGVLAPVQVEVQVNVPKDGLWCSPHSTFLCPDTIRIVPEKGQPLQACVGEPQRGQFRWRPDGNIQFAAADAGKRLVARYQFRPRRVVVLDAAPPTDYSDIIPLFGRALAEELGRRGFVVISAKDVTDAAAALGAASPRSMPPPGKLAALAQQVNAAYVLIPGIAIGQFSKEADVDTGIEWPRDKVGEQHPRNPVEEEPTISLPVTRHRFFGEVRLIVVDGATGAVVTDQVQSSIQKVRLYRFSAARRTLVRNLAQQIVAAWRESSRERGTGK